LILLVIIGVGGWWAYNKYWVTPPKRDSLTVVPQNSVFMVQTRDLSGAWTEISNSEVWKYLIQNPYFSDINSDIELLNAFLADNVAADAVLSGRSLLSSVHMVSGVDWDVLFVVDMKDIAAMIRPIFSKTLNQAEGFNLREREYNEQTVFELRSIEDPEEIIYLTLTDNLLVVTFTGSLIEKSVDGMNDNHWDKNIEFVKVSNQLAGNELFRFYFNFGQLQAFMKSYLSKDSESAEMIAESLTYSAFDMYLRDELLSFDGYTGVDSIGSYIKALAGVRPGSMSAWRIASDQTALYFSMGFENYMDFYTNLTEQYRAGNAQDMEDIEDNVNKIEKYFGIDIEKQFFSWIGNEIAFLKLRPDNERRLEDVVVLIHANNITNAKAGMGEITKKVKRRSPVKFADIKYKNFDIFYLDRRNFFKLFFGDLFRSLEKPYFTYIEDFVVLSNSSEVLKSVIDDYITGRTLNNSEDFTDFKNEFKGKSNLTVFIRTPQIYENLYAYSTPEDKVAVKENRDFILSFSAIGFQLVSEGDIFNTSLKAKHNPNAVDIDRLERMEMEISDLAFRDYIDSMEFKVELPEAFADKDTFYIEHFAGTNRIKTEGSIIGGKPQGLWKTYYESGNIMHSVNYEEGEPQGESFFFYDTPKKTVKAQVEYDSDNELKLYSEFYENGARKSEIQYENGKADGDAKYYFRTGSLKIEAGYKDGMKHGRWKYYDENGDRLGVERWRNGEKRKGFDVF
jgi:antitoxin component YwqK of YwqJK toxin-antitoxin module